MNGASPLLPLLVTGGTGGLGRPTVNQLRSAGHEVRVLSRTEGPGRVVGNLDTGAGLDSALDGVKVVLHLATNRKNDAAATSTLLDAALKNGVEHVVYISIVGIDRIPFAYYASKLECERLIESSGIPHTILRATQFHNFVSDFLVPQRRLPFLVAPAIPVQPIAIEEVAARLVELAEGTPLGRVDDIGGPERGSLPEFARQWQQAHGTRKPTWSPRIPGKFVAAFMAGHHMTELPGYGTQTFAEFARAHANA
ncbi:MAG: SDR family oxidoreductase [Rhodoglobus sp.]